MQKQWMCRRAGVKTNAHSLLLPCFCCIFIFQIKGGRGTNKSGADEGLLRLLWAVGAAVSSQKLKQLVTSEESLSLLLADMLL